MQPVPNYDYYSEWDKFNVDEELERLDAEEKKSAQKVVSPQFNCWELREHQSSNLISECQYLEVQFSRQVELHQAHITEIVASAPIPAGGGKTERERRALATREKEKGNEAFKAKEYKEAIVYYTRSLELCEDATVFANRAATDIKLMKWTEAEVDCDACLRLQPGNLKALFRRGVARIALGRCEEAVADLEEVALARSSHADMNPRIDAKRHLGQFVRGRFSRTILQTVKRRRS